jgi:hypothetical protein
LPHDFSLSLIVLNTLKTHVGLDAEMRVIPYEIEAECSVGSVLQLRLYSANIAINKAVTHACHWYAKSIFTNIGLPDQPAIQECRAMPIPLPLFSYIPLSNVIGFSLIRTSSHTQDQSLTGI